MNASALKKGHIRYWLKELLTCLRGAWWWMTLDELDREKFRCDTRPQFDKEEK